MQKKHISGNILRGSIYMLDFGEIRKGCRVQAGYRPAIVIQNDIGNRFSPTVTVVPLSASNKKPLPTHVRIEGCGLNAPSTALCEQIMTVDRLQIKKKLGQIPPEIQKEIDRAISIQIGIEMSPLPERNKICSFASWLKDQFYNRINALAFQEPEHVE